ncbi:hypothetical protein BDY24DRAFT_129356 [Mrakia frigida]|uniref:zinc finger MYND domain-containing protein n=1 Tax=Mrakia frigida TaxID=29902 RepID=UPI003FCBFA1F
MQNIGDHDALSEIRYSAILGSLLCSPGSKPWESYEAHWRQQFPWLACELKRTEGEGREPCRVLVKGEEMMMCSRCRTVRYCCRAHQKAHWKSHKSTCIEVSWD